MERKQFIAAHSNITEFLFEHNISYSNDAINIEKEWTEFRFTVADQKQMERLNTWLQDELKQVVKTWSDIQIDAPNPVTGKHNELRVRIYEINL